MTPLPQPRANARIHVMPHRVNGIINAYQKVGNFWRLFVQLDDGQVVTVGAHEARYVDGAGAPGDLVMPAPASPAEPAGGDPGAPYRDAVALAERILANQPVHESVQGQMKRLAAALVDIWHLARGLTLGDAQAHAHAAALFTPPRKQGSDPWLDPPQRAP